MKNLLYIIPNLKKVKGGSLSRITDFKKVFRENKDLIIENNKILSALKAPKTNVVYVESATNRIGLNDFFALLILKFKSEKLIVFIRDIYIELFPEGYKGFRKSITLFFNKISNYFLTLIASELAFPTEEMGNVFFEKNKKHPRREFFSLPPAVNSNEIFNFEFDPEKKAGILFLGGTHYVNSGIDTFLKYAEKLEQKYNFFILTPDSDLKVRFKVPDSVNINYLKRNQIPDFLKENNILMAYHSRPRNFYDDITFPIKVLDFINFGLPFLTERHIPLETLLGDEYELFVKWEDLDQIKTKTKYATIHRTKHLLILREIAEKNTYKERYNEIIKR